MPDSNGDLYHAPDQLSALKVHGLHGNVLLDYVGGTNPIYVGWARPGTDPAESAWRICLIAWDVNSNPTSITWASGDTRYRHIWNNRALLLYL